MAPHRRLQRLPLLAAIVTAASLFAFLPPARAEEVVTVSGTGAALGVMSRLAVAFAAANPGMKLRVLPSVGSSGAVQAVARSGLDVGVLGRPLEPSERSPGLVAVPFARTAFVLAVGPRAGITSVTAAELARLYRGDVGSWPGGERVRVVLRPRTDVDDRILRTISGEVAAAVDAAHSRPGMLVALTNQECDDMLAHTPGAIGPTSLSEVVTNGGHPTPIAWNGVAPTLPNLASGTYPLSKTLVLVVRAEPSSRVRRFLAFLETPEATRVIEAAGSLPLAVPHLD